MDKEQNTNWIWGADWQRDQEKAQVGLFRKKFFVEDVQQDFIIQISAESRYKLYVNEKLVSIGPAKGDREVWFLDEVNIKGMLKKGENILAAEVLHYPVNGWGNHSIFRTITPGLYIQEKSGQITADETWKCFLVRDFRIVSEFPWYSQLQILEKKRGDAQLTGWKKSVYDDSKWDNASCYKKDQISRLVSPGNLQKRQIPLMNVIPRKFVSVIKRTEEDIKFDLWNQLLKGKKEICIKPHTHQVIEIDAGELMCGFISLRMKQGKGCEIRLLTSEGYVSELPEKIGGFAKKGDRTDWVHGKLCGFTDTYFVAGNGSDQLIESYEPFWFRTFRYIQLDIYTADEPLILSGLDYCETGYPLEVISKIKTSDSSLEDIWEISLRSLKRCMQETYTDCPFYEQLQYAMDARSQILYTYAIAGDDRLARQCMNDFKRSQRADGTLNSCYPDTEPNVIPTFSIYYILMIHDFMLYYGDKKFIAEHLGCMDNILNYFAEHLEERGLVGKIGGKLTERGYWSFIDWAPQWEATTGMPDAGLTGPITMESFLYIYGLMHAAEIMEYMDRKDAAREYKNRAENVRAAINKFCRDQNGVYLDGPDLKKYSQHCQVFALLTESVSIEKGRKILLQTLKDTERYAPCSVAMAFYLFRALEMTNLYEKTDLLWNTWRKMLQKHLTTCVENMVDERSDCHAWGAVILYEMPAVILGVRPCAPAYQKVLIHPIPGYLKWAEGEVVTPHGNIKIFWKKEKNGKMELEYEIPKTCSAEVIVKEGENYEERI